MKIQRADEHRRIMWKNGQGYTTELFVSPPGADLDAMDYRVFTARVTGDEPFSQIPGVDRTLFITEGNGLDLTLPDGSPIRVAKESPAHLFSADAATPVRLVDGPTTDFNVITRRSRCRHRAERLYGPAEKAIAGAAGPRIVVCTEGRTICETANGASAEMMPGDAVFLNQDDGACRLTLDPAAEAISIALFALSE